MEIITLDGKVLRAERAMDEPRISTIVPLSCYFRVVTRASSKKRETERETERESLQIAQTESIPALTLVL